MEQNQHQQSQQQQQWQGPERRQSQGPYQGTDRRKPDPGTLEEAAGGPGVIPQDQSDIH
jgi:hypothetical protein